MLEVGMLGPLRVRSGGCEVEIAGRRERCLLAALALRPGQTVSVSTLVDHLWGDDPPRTANKSIQTAVANLRRTLRDNPSDGWLETTGAGYRLNVSADAVDVTLFEASVAAGRAQLAAGDPAVAAQRLSDGLARWRGDTPAELGDGLVADIESNRLVELRLDAQADWFDAEISCGRHQQALAELGALCRMWPLRERFHELLMLALYRGGRQADALAAYQQLRSTLIDHGLEPGERARRLEGRILAHDPSLDEVAEVPVMTVAGRSPPPRRGLVGRDPLLADLARMLARSSLLTLVGPGGVGKTALATHLAAGASDRHPEWCSLGAVSDAGSLVPALATSLGIDQRAGSSMEDAICERLQIRPTLLVLDNCEHLLEAAANCVANLMAKCRTLVVLATSRERLSVPGETVWPIEGLGLPQADDDVEESAAVMLFLERARQSDPHFYADARAMASIAAICNSLDGLPLALELAAARVRALPPTEIAKRLDDRFELFRGGHRDAGERQRSLRATVAWSYDLLGEHEQRLFRRLGSFAGAFTLEAAEAVGALDDLDRVEIPALLADLVDKSMVTVKRDGTVWHYRLLETLRAFAREELVRVGESGAAEQTDMAYHRDLIASLGLAVTGPREAEAVAGIEGAFDNLRQAILVAQAREDSASLGQLVAGLCAYLHFRPQWEASTWADAALAHFERSPGADPSHRTTVAAIAAWGHWFAGDLERAEAIVTRGRDLAGPDDPALADLLATDALILMYRQDPRAQASASEAYNRAQGDDRRWLAAYLAGQLAIMQAYAGRAQEAAPHLEQQRRLVRALGNDSSTAWWYYCQAEVSGEADPAETIRLARLGTVSAAAVRSSLLENITRITAVTVEARHGDARATLDEFASLIDLFRRRGAWTHLMVVVWNLVEAMDRLGVQWPAAVLLHAAPDRAPVPYGDQLARLDRIRSRLSAGMPGDEFDEAAAEGAGLTREQTAEFALAALAGL